MNYTQLQAAIADYLHRSDLTAQIPTFISLAEATLFREVSIPETETSANGTITGGYGALPADFGSITKISVTYGGAARLLDYINIADVYTATEASPGYYTFQNGQIRIFGAGDGQTYTLYYIPALAPLSSTVSTNWLLENAQDLYFYSSCLEAAKFTRDQDEIVRLGSYVGPLLDSVRRNATRKLQPSMTTLQIKPRR